jgi:transcriptional regulator with XRE-family HTH domain
MLLRQVIGDALRARRLAQHRTLREVSGAARVSLGYLSEVERGQKEASSELLGAICDALGVRLSEVLRDVSDSFAMEESGALAATRRMPVLEPVAPRIAVATAPSGGPVVAAA